MIKKYLPAYSIIYDNLAVVNTFVYYCVLLYILPKVNYVKSKLLTRCNFFDKIDGIFWRSDRFAPAGRF